MDPESRGQYGGLSTERLKATRDLMKRVLPEAEVADYHSLVPCLQLPDPDDRHVLAAAIADRASIIVTWNLADFPDANLSVHGVSARSPDAFLADLCAAAPEAVAAALANARHNLRKSIPSIEDFYAALERQGLKSFLDHIRGLF